MSTYKIAIGLGNIDGSLAGRNIYEGTRHNIGASFVSRMAEEFGAKLEYDKYCCAYISRGNISGNPVVFVFMKGYMNESGVNLKNVLGRCRASIEDCIVFYDEISIPVGKVKISEGGSAGGHNGIADIMARCGNSFARVRIGVGAKTHKDMDLADHVLGKIPDEEKALYNESYLNSKKILESLVKVGLAKTQNVFNRTEKPKKNVEENKELENTEILKVNEDEKQ